jgi:eukaryotic-like serine/threonine-protein kinase
VSERLAKATDQAGLLLGAIAPGDRIADYVIDEHLPTRGTGHLYLASHLVLPRRAVINVLPLAVGVARELVVELLREACIVDAIDHPGVPRLFETGVLPDRRHWVAIEHIDGPSLADALDAHAVEDHAVMTIVRDVADVLASVHAQGLVHANVVPSAIVVPTRARRHPLCLVDWASARTLDSTRPLPLSPPRTSLGYLAPEQLHGKPIERSADVFALGMIARELGADAQSDLPPLFQALVDRMLALEPADRPTASDVRETITWLCAQADDSARVHHAPR